MGACSDVSWFSLAAARTAETRLGYEAFDNARSWSIVDNLKALEVRLEPSDIQSLDTVSKPDWGYPYSFIAMRERW